MLGIDGDVRWTRNAYSSTTRKLRLDRIFITKIGPSLHTTCCLLDTTHEHTPHHMISQHLSHLMLFVQCAAGGERPHSLIHLTYTARRSWMIAQCFLHAHTPRTTAGVPEASSVALRDGKNRHKMLCSTLHAPTTLASSHCSSRRMRPHVKHSHGTLSPPCNWSSCGKERWPRPLPPPSPQLRSSRGESVYGRRRRCRRECLGDAQRRPLRRHGDAQRRPLRRRVWH